MTYDCIILLPFRSLLYQKDLQEVVTALEQQHQIDPIAIELVDCSVAKLYKESTRSKVCRIFDFIPSLENSYDSKHGFI